MANTNVSHSEVKSICDKLECSPSAKQSGSPYGGAPSLSPKSETAAASGSTNGFNPSGVPGYGSKMAKKAKKA